jgi:hypothetical protein
VFRIKSVPIGNRPGDIALTTQTRQPPIYLGWLGGKCLLFFIDWDLGLKIGKWDQRGFAYLIVTR